MHCGQITDQEGAQGPALFQRLVLLTIAPDYELARKALDWNLHLGAAYNSFYVALVEGPDCELWTADRRLHNAADLPWVHLAGTPS